MAVLTASGRAAVAAAIKDRPLHLAWGRGDPDWETPRTVTAAFAADDRLDLGRQPVKAVTVTSEDATVTFTAGTDYSVDATIGVLTRLPEGAIAAEATVAVAFTVATPPETLQATALIDEVGRRQATTIAFVTPDGEGEIVVPNGRFALSETPTAHLYLEFRYDFDDAAAATIRELGVYVDTEIDPGVPSGQRYFEGTEIAAPGILLVLENILPIVRTPATRETFVFVISF